MSDVNMRLQQQDHLAETSTVSAISRLRRAISMVNLVP